MLDKVLHYSFFLFPVPYYLASALGEMSAVFRLFLPPNNVEDTARYLSSLIHMKKIFPTGKKKKELESIISSFEWKLWDYTFSVGNKT